MKINSEKPVDYQNAISPFHSGEQEIQHRLGVREKMEQFGRKVIRNYMPEQHRTFYQQLPYLLVGHVDDEGWPWASILCRPESQSFIRSKSSTELSIAAKPLSGDPLQRNLQPLRRMGLLGIELDTRRRNRLSATITEIDEQGIHLSVDQSFGNCPQYIQRRECTFVERNEAVSYEISAPLDEETVDIIRQADTFFVSSYAGSMDASAMDPKNTDKLEQGFGVDISHRGGAPGFVHIENGKTLTIPDYVGNFHFNTLGNFLVNPRAGLLFIDFERGHLLMLTGTAEILWDSPDQQYFEGAERFWRFNLERGVFLKNTLAVSWSEPEFSVNTSLTGSWSLVEQQRSLQLQRQRWLPYSVTKIIDESTSIRSFYLQREGGQKHRFNAGQFLTIRVPISGELQVRTYTVSSAPASEHYRISVKRDGLVSTFLHDEVSVGAVLEAKAPTGQFVFDTTSQRPAVLMAAGVGITPVVSMLGEALVEAVRTRYLRPLVVVLIARNQLEQAFYQELDAIERSANGAIRLYWCLTQPEPGVDCYHRGRVDRGMLEALLPQNDSDVYLCGPVDFMQASYRHFRDLGVPDRHIYAEAFGPSSLTRDVKKQGQPAAVADSAIVSIMDDQGRVLAEQAWSKGDGMLLDFAESHGISPPYGCRSGRCGACRSTLLSGEVVYEQDGIELGDGVLLCCAQPAASGPDEIVELSVRIPDLME